MSDLRFAIRQLLKHPGLTAMAVLTFGLGLAANATMFSVVRAFLFPPLPYKNAGQLFVFLENRKGADELGASIPDFLDWKQQDRLCQRIVSFTPGQLTMTGRDQPEGVSSYYLSAEAFALLGVQPRLGRSFTSEEDRAGSERVVILSHDLWQSRFDGRQDLIGQSVKLDGEPHTVVGVMPPDLTGFLSAKVYLPFGCVASAAIQDRADRRSVVVGRVKPGVDLAEVQTQIDTIAARLALNHPATNEEVTVRVLSLRHWLRSDYASVALILFCSVVFVLLIACANVAGLLLARAASRQKEIAIRVAIGASRLRVVRQLLTESVILALAGGVAGTVLAFWAVGVINAVYPFGAHFRIDGSVLGFAAGATLLAGVLAGLAPSVHASRPDLNEVLKEGTQKSASVRSRRFRDYLVAAEIGLALVLLCGAGLLSQSFLRYERIDKGFDPKNVLSVVLDLPLSKYRTPSQVQEFSRNVLTEIARLPGVQSAAASAPIRLSRERDEWGFVVPGWEPGPNEERPIISIHAITPDYFTAMQIPLLRGRTFTGQDADAAANMVIINERVAQRFWPNAEPIGQSIKLGGRRSPQPWGTVVGVTKSAVGHTWYEPSSDVFDLYVPFDSAFPQEVTWAWLSLYVRTASDPGPLREALRKAIWAVDKDQPILFVRTMDEMLYRAGFTRRAQALLMGIFAALSVLLSAVGLYSLVSHAVTQRTREIGIRMALGAQRRDVVSLVLRNGMILALIGIAAGLFASFALTAVIANQLYAIQSTDPVTFVSVTALLMGITLLASYIPARRATKVDPMEALRCE